MPPLSAPRHSANSSAKSQHRQLSMLPSPSAQYPRP
jgi:hypothetical protein